MIEFLRIWVLFCGIIGAYIGLTWVALKYIKYRIRKEGF